MVQPARRRRKTDTTAVRRFDHARTIWANAVAAGIGNKLGKSRFVHSDDFSVLLQPARKSAEEGAREVYKASELARQRRERLLKKLKKY